MGLKTTHGCWSGSYFSFAKFRRAVAKACGIDLDRMEGFGGCTRWNSLPHDPIHALLNHSDCDGKIAKRDLIPLAEKLKVILPKLMKPTRRSGNPAWIPVAAIEFAIGCRAAADEGKPVRFA